MSGHAETCVGELGGDVIHVILIPPTLEVTQEPLNQCMHKQTEVQLEDGLVPAQWKQVIDQWSNVVRLESLCWGPKPPGKNNKKVWPDNNIQPFWNYRN